MISNNCNRVNSIDSVLQSNNSEAALKNDSLIDEKINQLGAAAFRTGVEAKQSPSLEQHIAVQLQAPASNFFASFFRMIQSWLTNPFSFLTQSNALKTEPSTGQSEKRQSLLQTVVQPMLKEKIDSLIENNKDFISIANALKDRHSPFLEQWAMKALKKLESNGINKEEQQFLQLTKDDLIDQFIISLEELGVNHYYISKAQILHLQNGRNYLSSQLAEAEKIKLSDLQAQVNPSIKVRIPELHAPLMELEKDAFKEYIEQEEKKLAAVQKEVATLKEKKGKQCIIPQQLNRSVLNLKEEIFQLKQAYQNWENRGKYFKPSNLIVEFDGSNREVINLTPNFINLIKKNISDSRIKIEKSNKEDLWDSISSKEEIARLKKLEQAVANIDSEIKKAAFAKIKAAAPTGARALLGSIIIPPLPLQPIKGQHELAFNTYEIENLKLLTKVLEDDKANKPFSKEEKEKVNSFIAFAKKNDAASKSLNAKLCSVADRKTLGIIATVKMMGFDIAPEDKRLFKKIPYGISEEAVEIAMTLSYNFKTPEMFAPLIQKFENLLKKGEANEEIIASEQLTLRELGMLQKCAKMNHNGSVHDKGILQKLEPLGAYENTTGFKELQALSNKAANLLAQAQKIFSKQTDYQAGDIVANIGRQKIEMAGRKADGGEEVHFRLITPYCHGAKIYKNEGKTILSHVVGAYFQEEWKMVDDAYSEVWRLDVAALIPAQQHALMEEKYGKRWKEILQKKFQAIENHIQQNKNNQFTDLENSYDRRFAAGKADYIWGGHFAKTDHDFEKMADQMLGEREDKEHMTDMICSEFSSKTTLAALVKLNRDLTKELEKFLIEKGEVELGQKLKADKNVLELPFDRKERMELIHPGRMIDLLVKRNCVHKLERPKILQQILKPEIK
ncbi:MAG: hypothetical protein H0V82_11450 [Candidatus Protochlamydia sp.]|nr:hypothetical protein [Candidatus Protochlamydia sp.]